MARKLIIDCDPGCDDAQAIIMALCHKEIDTLAITTVKGNCSVDNATINTLRILEFKQREINVFKGSELSLTGNKPAGNGFHGLDGLGDTNMGHPSNMHLLKEEPAANALVRLVNLNPNEITLIAIGPLTNIALAIHLDPKFGQKLKNIIVMGGNYKGRGNVTRSAEFNFYDDPEAAKFVLEKLNPVHPICVITYELCWDYSASWEWYDNLLKTKSQIANFIHSIDQKITQNAKNGSFPNYPTYDQLAMAVFIDRSMIKTSIFENATVCADEGICRGQMVIDWRKRFSSVLNVEIVTELDQEKLLNLMWNLFTDE